MQHPEIKITEDGSHTLYVAAIDECYHSTHGSVQESSHIFIRNGLFTSEKDTINVLEIGFGTGLNAFLTLTEQPSTTDGESTHKNINYTAVELYPVSVQQALQLNYPEVINGKRNQFEALHQAAWNVPVKITDYFILTKLQGDFTQINFSEKFDVIYFDAFSPEKQPEMWSEDMFRKLYLCTAENAVLTTYCAKGAVRRAMQTVGFSVERLPGPPGKREILRARKLADQYN
ncbi:MAG: tRNA (5-methylaminomethyl-2-thiouridine)(34)-methyltransferase MnmD [Paludibacteraceae bacterium]